MFTQFEITYCYNDLEPVIDALTVETHYGKHHATYTSNLNALAEKAGVADREITDLLANLEDIAEPALIIGIRNNGGGFYNHNLYFEQLTPNGSKVPTGELADKIDETFGSFESFKEKISALAIGQFGSGWAWLSVTPTGELEISNSLNQDNPISLGTGNTPIFTIDVWEHAYYLKYKNLRAKYVEELFNIVNWDIVAQKYKEALR